MCNKGVFMFGSLSEMVLQIKDFLGFHKFYEITVPEFVYESDKFVFIEWKEQGFWLEKSKIIIESQENDTLLKIPEYLMNRINRIAQYKIDR